MSIALIDDQLLGRVLRDKAPRVLAERSIYTTGCWYVRLCQAVLRSDEREGALSRPFAELAPELRERAVSRVLELPAAIGLLSLRDLAPIIARLRADHQLNVLGMEALAAAVHLRASVHLSAPSPLLEAALREHHLRVRMHR